MNVGNLLLWMMFFLSITTVMQKNLFHAVLMRMALSAIAVGAYAVYLAPDVAITEAMLGAILTTFVYILILKIPGRIRVGYIPLRFLFEEYPWGFDGIQYEIVRDFARRYGYRLEYEKFDDERDLIEALKSGYIDLACGPILTFEEDLGVLETRIYRIGDRNVDFLSLQRKISDGILNEEDVEDFKEGWYTVGFSRSHPEFKEFLKMMRSNGAIDRIKEKYVR
ncbi:MAG: DUF4040 domain-containing protein [Thermotogae bacterium]|nr:DUF4040 domain-containing protein [Thermotogota bacterium]